jgi:uncharacterized protein YndB with AHSA1/START domain
MTTRSEPATDVPVRKTIRVNASPERAFHVFAKEFDTWWPRTHHIGHAPMKRAVIQGVVGGRCYTEQVDGTECEWGTVLVWDPPHRLVLAWQIDGQWQYEPDLANSSEVEVRFTPESDGSTRVDLEHRYLSRHGADAGAIRTAIDSPTGWGGLLALFATQVEEKKEL